MQARRITGFATAAGLALACGGCGPARGRTPAAASASPASASHAAPAALAAPAHAASAGPRLPARVRRLTNAEYERTVSELVGADEAVAERLPPDVRQDGYTPNDAQVAPSAWVAAVDVVARDVAHRVVRGAADRPPRLERLAPCARLKAAGCGDELVDRLGARAWRRPLEDRERAALRTLFEAASREGGFDAGAEALLTALLESPGLAYLTELGPGGPPGAIVTLTPYEIASLLSYTLRGAPPDDALLGAAADGSLRSPPARVRHALRLLAMPDTRLQFRRFVLEWLEVDGLARTTKSAELFPRYESLKERMIAETSAFTDEVMVFAGGSVGALLGARFASVDPEMARFYGLRTWGARASLAGTRRAGVLQQASFLAAHAHEDGTSPVKRGDFVLRRLLCVRVPRPAEVGIETVFPAPSRDETNRQRFSIHAADPACRGCHRNLDGIGFAFEGFDAAGADQSRDNGKPVDTAGRLTFGGESMAFGDSLQLSDWLAQSPAVAECYLRQAFRYFTAQSDPRVEDALVALARKGDGNLFDALMAYVGSDLFVEREVRP